MAEKAEATSGKKAAAAAKPAATAAKKAAPAAKAGTKRKTAKGAGYTCEVCGLVVSVDETCGCVETCDIICCGTPMKETKAKAK